MFRSSHRRCSVTKDFLWNFAKFTGKHLCQGLFFNKVAGLRLHRCFPVNLAKFLRTPFATDHLQWLLLYVVEEKLQQSKLKSLKLLLLNITTLVKLILYSSTCSIQLTCLFFIHDFQSSILHKLKNTLNCWLKLNKDNNRSFLVAYTTSIPASRKCMTILFMKTNNINLVTLNSWNINIRKS